MNELLILDLENNNNFKAANKNILFINRGKIKLQNCKILNFNINNKSFKNQFIKDFLYFLNKLKKDLNKNLRFINSQETEFFNLRNDRISYYEKLCTIFFISKYYKKIKNKKIITDNPKLFKIYKQLFKTNTEIQLIKKNIKISKFQITFHFIKFIMKSIYFVFLNKIFLKNKKYNKEDKIFLSIYPYFFDKKNNIRLYNQKEILKLNFSITDETHLNLKKSNYINHIFELKKINNLLSVENYISFFDYIKIITKFIIDHRNFQRHIHNKSFKFKNIDIRDILIDHLNNSFLNRFKLMIYESAIKRIVIKFNFKEIHYFLFEYCFGFFLSNLLKNNFSSSKIKRIGYQHGIFTSKLMWLDILNLDNSKKNFFPEKIVSNEKSSIKYYKKYFKNVTLQQNLREIKIPRIDKSSNNILVFTGQHDLLDCYNFFTYNKDFKSKKVFIKLHPNNKIKILSKFRNIFIVKNFDNKKKYKIFISQTSTLVYYFKKMKYNFRLMKFNYKFDLF